MTSSRKRISAPARISLPGIGRKGTSAAKAPLNHEHAAPTDSLEGHLADVDPHPQYYDDDRGHAAFATYAQGANSDDHIAATEDVHGVGVGSAVVGTGTAQTLSSKKFSDGIVIEKTAGIGIKVDVTTPTFGFRDLLGEIKILSPGANDPTLAVFRDGIRAFSFSNAVINEAHLHYHVSHDYVPASDIFVHFHWSQNVVDTGGLAGVPGNVKWQAEVTYAKGHNQSAFPASFTTSITQTASGTQYQHMLAEVQLSAASPSATQIDSDIIEPDGLIILRAFRDPTDVADTLDQVPFLHYVDIHYQSTNLATKAKAPNFYA